MRVRLVPGVPDDPVFGRVENVVKREGQFDRAESRSKVAADLRDNRDHFFTDLGGELV